MARIGLVTLEAINAPVATWEIDSIPLSYQRLENSCQLSSKLIITADITISLLTFEILFAPFNNEYDQLSITNYS